MAIENKKQLFLLIFAIFAGIAASVFVGTYVTQETEKRAQVMKDEFEARQREAMAAMQQDSEQKMAALAQEINRVRTESAEVMRQQMANMQAAQASQGAQAVTGKKPSLALKTPEGKRAVTIMINSLSAVGGLLNPGDFVDVIAQLSVPSGSSKLNLAEKNIVTAMIFQDLQILAVNTNLEQEGLYYDQQQGASSIKVTVAVDPKEAGLLSFADKNGKLELALRSPQERDRQMVQTSTWKTLADYVMENQGADIDLPASLKGVVESKEEKPKDDKQEIQIFRGGKEL